MALKSTVFRASLAVSDLDRGHFASHALTLARHPSETDERLMVRLLAFALHADERLAFGRGLSTEDEPALWLKDDAGSIRLWIEVGQPDERLLRRAAGRADEVVVLAYGGRAMEQWWLKEEAGLARIPKLRVIALEAADTKALAALAVRNMEASCTVQDGQLWFACGDTTLEIVPRVLLAP